MDAKNRHYSEEELAAIIKRATEIHEESKDASGSKLSMSELEVIADDLGIPKAHLRQAASELQYAGPKKEEKRFTLLGGPFVQEDEWILDRELTEDDWENLVLEARSRTNKPGATEQIGRAREWANGFEDGGVTLSRSSVNARPEDGRTKIVVKKNYTGKAILSYGMGLALSAFLTILVDAEGWGEGIGPLFGIMLLIGIIGSGWLASRGLLGLTAKKQEAKTQLLSAQLRESLRETAYGVDMTEKSILDLGDYDSEKADGSSEKLRISENS